MQPQIYTPLKVLSYGNLTLQLRFYCQVMIHVYNGIFDYDHPENTSFAT